MTEANRRSKNITQGVARAPNRSMYYAMGYQSGDFVKPMIGVANGHSTITPCNSGLQKLADAAVDAQRRATARAGRGEAGIEAGRDQMVAHRQYRFLAAQGRGCGEDGDAVGLAVVAGHDGVDR